jgi:hypothetical protein
VVARVGQVRSLVMQRQFFRNAKPCSLGARCAATSLLVSFSAAVSGFFLVFLTPVMTMGSSGLRSRPMKPRSARAPRPAARRCSSSFSPRHAAISLADPWCALLIHSRLPLLVGDPEEEQAVGFVLAVVVAPVLPPGTPVGLDQRAVEQHDLAAGPPDLVQRPVQARGAGGDEPDQLVDPAFEGGGDPVAQLRQLATASLSRVR